MKNEVTKIKEVRVRPVRVPMKEPHRTAGGTIEAPPPGADGHLDG